MNKPIQLAIDEYDKPRNFLTITEVNRLVKAAKKSRYGIRNYALCLMAFRHGYRVSELVGLRIDDLDLAGHRVFVRRKKGSLSTMQPMRFVRSAGTWGSGVAPPVLMYLSPKRKASSPARRFGKSSRPRVKKQRLACQPRRIG